jgi:hypothetical protein
LLDPDDRCAETFLQETLACHLNETVFCPIWTSISAMMFRRAALNILRPNRELAYKRAFDAYMAQGAQLFGKSAR